MILLVADIHGPVNFHRIRDCEEINNLTEKDYLFVCGDFGIVWGESTNDKMILDWIEKKSFSTLFIDGNHENFHLLNNYPVTIWNGGKIHQIRKNIIHLMRGQVFNIHNLRIFTFGGGFSLKRVTNTSPITTWEEEMPNQGEYEEGLKNLKINNYTVDYIITHSAPKKWIREIGDAPNEYEMELNDYLNSIESKTVYRHWYFGHFHKDIKSDKYTVLYENLIRLES